MRTRHYQLLAKTGYFGLLILIPVWHLWLSPPLLDINPWLVTSIWFIPLLFPLKGILQKNPYTYAWSGFLALFYLMHAIVILSSEPSEWLLASIELLCASFFLIGDIYFAKYRGRELGLSIRKKKAN
ncbi:DUF2069 domain-containing protein [Psychromonas sp.]|uniref:DUF2069 domain-containing protein n=1 Tax=Psychromonas sp. TaxID=1884585 RepID=UPI003565015A